MGRWRRQKRRGKTLKLKDEYNPNRQKWQTKDIPAENRVSKGIEARNNRAVCRDSTKRHRYL